MKKIVGACPLDCPDACSWTVTVDERGTPVRLEGNAAHPHTGKRLCAKVNPYLSYTRHPDRLLYPQKRVGPKGAGKFARIGWDEALGEIASRLRGVIDEFGGEAIWPYLGTGTMGYIQGAESGTKRLFQVLGASRHYANICSVAAYPGLAYTSGRGPSMEPMDVRYAGVAMLWGANTLSTNQHFWPFVREAQRNGAPVVVVDPVTTRTARHADVHLAIRPGTDGALALGLMSEIVRGGWVDPGVKTAVGWDAFASEELAGWSAERTAAECGIRPELVREVARWMGTRGPSTIRLGMGMQRHAAGGQAARVISCLPMITGDYRRRGGGLCYSTNPLCRLNVEKLSRPDLCPSTPRTLAMTRLGQGLLELDDPPVKALLVVAANPVASNPDQNRVLEGLRREDLFCAVVETFQTDTADFADILLPSTMQTEHIDIHNSVSHLYLNFNNPVSDPPGECLTHTEIFRRLARALGLDEPALYASDLELVADLLDTDHPSVAHIDLETLRREGFARLGYPEPVLPYATRFDTPSGRFEFASEAAERDGYGRFPSYVPPREAIAPVASSGARSGSIALIAAANHFLMNSTFANSDAHSRAGPPVIALHPDDASLRGLTAGQSVRVHNDRGEFFATVGISERTRPGVATMTKGHWPKLHGGGTINATTLEADADMAQGATFHDNQVFLTAVDRDANAPRYSEATR